MAKFVWLTEACKTSHFVNRMVDFKKSIFSRRLRQARMMKGLSLRDLVKALKKTISHNALAKYESGVMMPGSDVLGQLADALEQPPDFFFRPFTLHLKHIKFREGVRVNPNEEGSIRARSLEYFERYHELEELVGDVRKFHGKLRGKTVRTLEEAEASADRLRVEWKLGCALLPNIVELFENKGIKIFEIEVADNAFDGFSADTEIGPVFVVSKRQSLLRKRMTVVYEFAHVVLRISKSVSLKDRESISRRFAGALLMPKEKFVAEFGKNRKCISLGELIELKTIFGASVWAIMMRARQLELITEAAFARFCQAAAPWRLEKEEPGDEQYQGNEGHSRFRQLIHRAVAEGQISASKGAGMLNQSLGDLRKELREMFA